MFKTRLTELLGVRYPIIGGAMAYLSTGTLAAAVSEAGGFGLISAVTFDREELQREIARLKTEHGISILLTDHNVRETLSVTDRSYIIDEGKVLRQGPPRELINDPLVRRTYLGSTFRGDEFDQHQTERPAHSTPEPAK